MPCYQSSNIPVGVSTSGRTSFATQAACLEACKEGACCEGTTCTVKPQCQCKCATGSCCGPDTVTLAGVTGPVCRGGTKTECDARGGTWRDCIGCLADANNPNVSLRPCQSSDQMPSNAPVFKGVGTTCSPNPCGGGCLPCEGAALPPTVSLEISNFRDGPNALTPSQMATIAGAVVGTHTLVRSLPDIGGSVVYTTGSYDIVTKVGLQKWVFYPCDTGAHSSTGRSPLLINYGEGGQAFALNFGSGQFDLTLVNGQPVQFTSGSLCDRSATSRVGQITSTLANTGVLVAYFDWTAMPSANPLP